MPEYRRFIAYFYEYIDGRKQKNAGFAKVELRNGMWRILFRLTTDVMPQPPVHVYGFVREQGYLLGFPMGTMPDGCEIAQEWAYRADSPIGLERYGMEDLSGIWIQSGEERRFITVWDDDPIDPEKFVLELPQDEMKPQQSEAEEMQWTANVEQSEEENRDAEGLAEEVVPRTMQGIGETVLSSVEMNRSEKEMEENALPSERTNSAGKSLQEKPTGKDSDPMQQGKFVTVARKDPSAGKSCLPLTLAEEFLQKRQRFAPFPDQEIQDCVQLMPCDVIRMQQENWPVGRSSFLQHGFYQYHHLLFGRRRDGRYILGVPGVRSRQEQYMAGMLGYDQFKLARICDCGRMFGYWYRVLPEALS